MSGMSRSASAPLRTAGEAVSNKHAHVPRRATQHMIYMSLDEVPPVQLKPGQSQLERQLYTEESRPLDETYLSMDNPKGSIYSKGMANLTAPEDYKEMLRPFKPEEPPPGEGHHKVAHWGSEYRNSHSMGAISGAKKHTQLGPAHRPCNPPSCIGRAEDRTCYWDDHGKPGADPRSKLPHESLVLPTFRTHLTVGTTKATCHMPGYQGFLPTNTTNPRVAKIEQGRELRTTYNKANLTETFKTNTLGYQGHVPFNARNDFGGRVPTTRTTHGNDFPIHPLGVL